ncbi:MAG: PorT family protein [Flavobacteriales bacterium]|nr:PorT family protein [Flavobacteriales bacterium]
MSQNCTEKIETARIQYESGKMDSTIHLLSECIRSADPEIRFGALRITSLVYLALNDEKKARNLVVEMLRIHPDYSPGVLNNSLEFIRLVNSITVIPKFSLGSNFAIGTNYSLPAIETQYSILNDHTKKYSGKPNLNISFSGVYHFTENFGLSAEISFLQKNFETDYSTKDLELISEEKLSYGNLILALKIVPNLKRKLIPFIQIGAYAGRLLNARAKFSYKNYETGEIFSLENVNSIQRRSKFDNGLAASAGLTKRFKKGQLVLNCMYLHSFTNITRADTRFDYPDLRRDYFYLDDDLRLNTLMFSLGYSVYLKYRVKDPG